MNFWKSCVAVFYVLLAPSVVGAQPQPGDYSPAKYEVVEELDRTAPMRDGVELMLDIFRPKEEGRFPAILQQTPYNKSGGAARAKRFAARGYVVINVDSRGRFRSGGDWDPFTPLHKSDGYDLVEWVAKQSWCTGQVGTYGLSYMGWTQWWTATQAPPSLKAMVPEVAPPDHLLNCPYLNGILVGWMMDWAGSMSGRLPHSAGPGAYGGFAVNREQAYRQTPYIDFDKTRKYLPTDWWRKWITQNTSTGEYWSGIAYQTPENYARVTVPSLAITGWFDANFNGSPLNYAGMKQHGGSPAARQPRMVIGPWEHIINTKREAAGVDFGPHALIDWDGYVCRWFDFHLKGIENGVMNDPPIHLFVMGRNQWRTATDWPLPETQFTKYYLHSGGHANSSGGDGTLSPEPPGVEEPDHYTYDPNDPTPSAGFTNGHIDGPRDIRSSAARKDVLVYTTAELTEDVELIGPITAKLFAATSARDTDWMIRLSDVHPDGRSLFLGEGVMRARHRDPQRGGGAFNPERLSTIAPDQAYEYSIDFWRPTGNRFARGHRIRIEISSSYYPYFLRNLNTGEDNIGLATQPVIARQTIFHDSSQSSHVVLPVIPVGKDVGLRKQLFVDDFVVAEKQRVTRELGQVTKANDGKPIFTDGWFYGSVWHDEGKFKLWFRKPGTNGFGYAESTDGLNFKKQADLQGINFAGDYTLAVEIDPAETDPQHRFKAGYDAPGMAAGIAHSADGIHWTPYHDGKPVTKRAADTYNQILWDPEAKTYRLFTRTDFGTAGGSTELRGTRSMTNPAPKTNPTNWTLVREWIFDKEGKAESQRRQIYATTCWIYHGVYFALLSVYDHPSDVSEGKETDTQKRHERDIMNFYIATSRDGDSWDMHWVYAGQPLVPRGPDGAFDKDLLLPASTIVTHADKHWIYYAGANERHGNEQVKFDRKHAIGLATLRLDGFVGLSAGENEGTVVTKPFKLEGDKLMVNIDAHGGEASVEVLDETGQPLVGYSGDAVVPATKLNELRWQPQWKKHTDLSALRNKVVRLKFRLRNAKLYSFQIGGEQAGR